MGDGNHDLACCECGDGLDFCCTCADSLGENKQFKFLCCTMWLSAFFGIWSNKTMRTIGVSCFPVWLVVYILAIILDIILFIIGFILGLIILFIFLVVFILCFPCIILAIVIVVVAKK